VKSMFTSELTDAGAVSSSFGMRVSLGVAGLLTLAIGVYPEPFLQFAQTSLGR